MKVRVNLPQEDVDFLDSHALSRGLASRSAAAAAASAHPGQMGWLDATMQHPWTERGALSDQARSGRPK